MLPRSFLMMFSLYEDWGIFQIFMDASYIDNWYCVHMVQICKAFPINRSSKLLLTLTHAFSSNHMLGLFPIRIFLVGFTEKTNNSFRNKYFLTNISVNECGVVCVYLMFEVLAPYLLIILVGTNFGQNIEPLEVSTRVTNSVRRKQKRS